MSFRNGIVSYARFRALESGDGTGASPVEPLLEGLAANTLRLSGIGEPQINEFGFCAGSHVFDTDFTAEKNVFGDSLLFGMRIDTNRVPADIKRAYRAMAESTYLQDSSTGFLSRREKQAAKEEMEERCRQELAEGKYRRSKMIEVLWDRARGVVLAPLYADATVQGLRDLFFNAFDLHLQPLSSGSLAYEILSSQGQSRDYEDLRPSNFGPRPAAAANDESCEDDRRDHNRPHVPWAHTSPEATDFIGNEFLLWLWWLIEHDTGSVEAENGEVLFAIDKLLEAECAWEVTGKQTLHADGPSRAPEAKIALRQGKWPRKAGLIIAAEGESFELLFQSDRFVLSGIKLPKPEEEFESPRVEVEHRLAMLQLLDGSMQNVFRTFVKIRASSMWSGLRAEIADWIMGRKRTGIIEPKSTAMEPSVVDGSGRA